MKSLNKKPVQLALLFFMVLFTPGVFLSMAVHLGFFADVSVSMRQKPEINALVIEHRGDYARGGKYIIEVADFLAANGYDCQPFSVFHHDTRKVIKKMLMSYQGCLLEQPVTFSNLPENIKPYRWDHQGDVLSAQVRAHPAIARIKAIGSLYKKADEMNKEVSYPVLSVLEPGANFYYFTTLSAKNLNKGEN